MAFASSPLTFLSIQAQDFIEENVETTPRELAIQDS